MRCVARRETWVRQRCCMIGVHIVAASEYDEAAYRARRDVSWHVPGEIDAWGARRILRQNAKFERFWRKIDA